MGAASTPNAVRDFWPRVLISPVLGAVVARASGLIDHSRYSPQALAAHYLVFAVVAFLIWEGNRRLYFLSRHQALSLERPWRRIARMGAVLVLFTVPATSTLLLGWRALSEDPAATDTALTVAVLMAMVTAAVITHAYETVFLRREWEAERLRVTKLERARLLAELDVLQRETSPHFLFNALNSALHLIESDPPRAARFVEALASHYRYILETRDRALVPLSDELDVLERFQPLVEIRFGGAVRLDRHLVAVDVVEWLVPPLCVQELFENAVKHTDFDRDNPLTVRLAIDGDELVVENRFQPRDAGVASTQRGLANLRERLQLTVGRPARWGREGDRFVVRVPLGRATAHVA